MPMGSNFRFSQRQKDKHRHLGNTIQVNVERFLQSDRKKMKEWFQKFQLQERNNYSAVWLIPPKVIFFQLTVKANLMQMYLHPALRHVQNLKLKYRVKNFSADKYTKNKLRIL